MIPIYEIIIKCQSDTRIMTIHINVSKNVNSRKLNIPRILFHEIKKIFGFCHSFELLGVAFES